MKIIILVGGGRPGFPMSLIEVDQLPSEGDQIFVESVVGMSSDLVGKTIKIEGERAPQATPDGRKVQWFGFSYVVGKTK